MSQISLKSISGITSITTPTGVDNQLTLHTNNTNQAFKLDSAGNIHVNNHVNITGISTASNFKTGTSNLHNTGLNVQDLDVDGHTFLDNVSISGVTTVSGILDATNTPASIRVAQDIQHKGDANTKITFPANDTISFDTGGNERLRITSSGKIGINTNNPQALLEIQDRSVGTLIGLSVGTQYGNAGFGGYNNYPAIMNNIGVPLLYCDTNNDRTILFGDTVGFGTTCSIRIGNAGIATVSAQGLNVTGVVTATAFVSDTPLSHRNLIINGQFLVWQRATDSGSNTTDGYLSCDRWYHASSGATKQVTRQTFSPGQTDVPDNPFYYLRYAVTTGNNNVALRQRVEDVTRCQGEMTLSFWVKGTNPGGGQFNLTFRQNFGSGGSSVVDHGVANYTVSNTWTKKTFTFTPPSISGKTVSGNKHTSYYEIELFRQPAADTSTAAFTVDFANVQLERGSVATPFEQKHLADEFRACQRYYQVFSSAYSYRSMLGMSILANSSTTIELMPNWKVDLRTTPTITTTGDQLEARSGVSGSADISLAGNNMSHSRELNQVVGHLWMTRSSGDAFVTGSSGRVFSQDSAYLNFDAEL